MWAAVLRSTLQHPICSGVSTGCISVFLLRSANDDQIHWASLQDGEPELWLADLAE
jgi:hypothetical protein